MGEALQNEVARCSGFSFEFCFLFGWLFVWLNFDLFCVNIGSRAAQADLKLTMKPRTTLTSKY